MTLEPLYLLLFAKYYINIVYIQDTLPFATTIYMWIGSQICLMARQPYASPPGYQSLASGDNVPDPGSQDTIGVPPHHGSTSPTRYNNNTLANSAPYLLHSSAHQEDANTSLVSHLGSSALLVFVMATRTLSCLCEVGEWMGDPLALPLVLELLLFEILLISCCSFSLYLSYCLE